MAPLSLPCVFGSSTRLMPACALQYDTAEMTGKVGPEQRKEIWSKKRVFFCTPQVLEKDMTKGILPISFCSFSPLI